MNCWICGNKGDSGEHEIKASDLRQIFGKIDQKNPIVWYSQGKGLKKVNGIKSNSLKFPELICKKCNNETTQPYDLAWEKLSKFLQEKLENVKSHGVIDLKSSFPDEEINTFVKNIQLYFVKIFGCLSVKGNIPVNLQSLSKSILSGIPHDSVYLLVCRVEDETPSVGYSDVRAIELNGKTIMSCFFYMVGKVAIGVVYDPLKREKKVLRKCLHPRNHGYKLNYRAKTS